MEALWAPRDFDCLSCSLPLPQPDKLVFGKILTNNMFQCRWTEKDGWLTPTISETTDLWLSPAASVLHYAVEV